MCLLLCEWRLFIFIDCICFLGFCCCFYSLACVAYCRESHRRNLPSQFFQLHFFIILSPLSLRWSTEDTKTEVSSAENPALPKVLSCFRDKVPSVDFMCMFIGRSGGSYRTLHDSGLCRCIPCYACDVCRAINQSRLCSKLSVL